MSANKKKRNLLVEICYNGSRYHGYQVQKNALAITEVLQDTIEDLLRVREPIIGCSRTDTGVHANSFFFNMPTDIPIPCDRFMTVMNRALPKDISVLSCREVEVDFHARYDCIGKEYLYKIYNAPRKDPFQYGLSLHHPVPIDAQLLHREAQAFVGTHNFTSFCSLGCKPGIPMERTISYVQVWREGDFVYLKIKADGFLYNMVRIIVGTLLNINDGKLPQGCIPSILEKRDRRFAGKTAGPEGLYLNHVEYGR